MWCQSCIFIKVHRRAVSNDTHSSLCFSHCTVLYFVQKLWKFYHLTQRHSLTRTAYKPPVQADYNRRLWRFNLSLKERRCYPSPVIALLRVWCEAMVFKWRHRQEYSELLSFVLVARMLTVRRLVSLLLNNFHYIGPTAFFTSCRHLA
jgi:hypothetical protein